MKKAYAEANDLLGDIVKVTPSSKTCGDLAQFMVTNGLSASDVRAKAASGGLNFPSSVVEFFQGALGIPVGGFPEPLRTDVLRGAKKLDETFEGRPGAELPDVDLEAVRTTLEATHGIEIDDKQLMSAVMYPKVFEDFMAATNEFGDLSALPTRAFVEPMEVGEEVDLSVAVRTSNRRGASRHRRDAPLVPATHCLICAQVLRARSQRERQADRSR